MVGTDGDLMENCFDFSKFAGHLINIGHSSQGHTLVLALVTSRIMSKLWN